MEDGRDIRKIHKKGRSIHQNEIFADPGGSCGRALTQRCRGTGDDNKGQPYVPRELAGIEFVGQGGISEEVTHDLDSPSNTRLREQGVGRVYWVIRTRRKSARCRR